MAAAIPLNASGARAQDIGPLTEALFSQMALTYMCRDALGGLAQYQATRSIATGALSPYIGEAEAVKGVAEMDARFRADPRAQNPNADPQKCMEMVNDGLFKIQVEREKLK